MKKEMPDINLALMQEKAATWLRKLSHYRLAIFIGFVLIVYLFVGLRIHSLTTAEPSQDAVTAQVKAAHVPRIEPEVVQQLQSLQDNSVNVQALFNQARNNPFQQ